ncbi:hypothetical protein DWZ16_07115 [Clostridium sp. AF29-8BH]|nr:hypothetical protein DWZ16_07115 [Clostridium sp. AF29-8BH]
MAYRLADVFSVRHQRFNRRMCGGAGTSGGKCGKNRVVVSYICCDLSILLAEDPEKERKQAHSRGRRDERAGLSTDKDDKGREMWIFLGKSVGCVENPAGGSCVQCCV